MRRVSSRAFVFIVFVLCRIQYGVLAAELDETDLTKRIERLRGSHFELSVIDPLGQPFNGELAYKLIRHHFTFGTVLHESFFSSSVDASIAEKYKEIARTYFNAGVHERFLKWRFIEPEQGKIDMKTGMKVWEWCHKYDMKMRGHCIFWGTDGKVQPWVTKLDAFDLENAMRAHAKRVLTTYDGKIQEFDINNQMVQQDYYARILGIKNGSLYFKWCKEIAPKTRFGLNELDIIGGKGLDQYVSYIESLQRSGAEIAYIGDQCRFSGPAPTNAAIWDSLDKLGQFGIPIQITELSFDIKDEAIQAENLKRFIKVCFAHPSVSGITLWGFWEGECNPPNAALWKRDWTPKESGKAFIRLLTEEFSSKGTVQVVNGKCQIHGFYGKYEVLGSGVIGTFSATPENAKPEIKLLKSRP